MVLPTFSIQELNDAIGALLDRGFAPRFLLHASVSRSQVKKGHLWLTLTDGNATITAVAWSSQLQKFTFRPNEGDGVIIVGKLNFWSTRATLAVQVLDLRPSISTVLRQFEIVKDLLLSEGVIDETKRRNLPIYPKAIALLTSVPSSALADMVKTAKERWPLTRLFVTPIPVQGEAASKIELVLKKLSNNYKDLGIEALILARGGGSREDLMVFDNERLCRTLAKFPLPVVTGLGHEDDLTVADLVADHRASTPTGAVVALLPCLEIVKEQLLNKRQRLIELMRWLHKKEYEQLMVRKTILTSQRTSVKVKNFRNELLKKGQLLEALSPRRWLSRGFAIVCDQNNILLKDHHNLSKGDQLFIEIIDARIDVVVNSIHLGGAVDEESK